MDTCKGPQKFQKDPKDFHRGSLGSLIKALWETLIIHDSNIGDLQDLPKMNKQTRPWFKSLIQWHVRKKDFINELGHVHTAC